ncbi:MAG: HAD-IC family P-type ATPase [Myxococcales bacterium]|nr:HAD-IC family P-type ATPase [Myxococcales bacterium]
MSSARWPGLDSAEAARRLVAEGPNALATSERRTALRLALEVVREPMFVLLIVAGGLYVAFGDVQEALTLLGFVVIVMAITIVQEGRTERALDALRDLSSPRAQVLRDGAVVTLAARDLVRGDVIRVAEGDRVPADAVLREGTALSVDESLLTGESVPVSKRPDGDAAALGPPGGDGTPALFAGTVVVAGRGVAEVLATGPRSQLGRIGASLREVAPRRTPLQTEIGTLVRWFAIGGGALAIGLAVIRLALGTPWRDALLAGITLAMALLPEELPVVMTVFLALGAWRIARDGVLTRRVTAVETLGGADVLCTDKTGTLTQNRMTIARLVTADADVAVADDGDLPEAVHALVEAGILACPRDPFDPMETAFWALARRTLAGSEHLHPAWRPVREYPLSPELLAVTRAWQADDAPGLVVATKGAPEAVFELCHLDEAAAAPWRARVAALATQGLRVLAVARSPELPTESPAVAHDVGFALIGLVGLVDPLRPAVPAAVAQCRAAGIRVVMITGDHPDTARAIARAAGIDAGDVVTGAELEGLDDEALGERLARTAVVARAVPDHKLRIIRALQRRGLVVGMTGDGVNDAPALRAADIGVAMGARGTDVAREAAALVLVDDDFAAIVAAVRTGRRVYDNLRAAIGYIVAVHLPIAGLALVPALLGWPPILGPAHVLFLELIIDPACSIVFEAEPEDAAVMARPPRSRAAHLFDARAVAWSVAQGLTVLAAALAVIAWGRDVGLAAGEARAAGFTTLVLGNLATLIASRSTRAPWWRTLARRNRTVPWLVGGAAALLGAILAIAPVRGLFGLAAPDLAVLGVAALAGVAVLALDLGKR